LRETMLEVGTISEEDLDLALVTDKIEEAIDYINSKTLELAPAREEDNDIY
jgi:hypothetical protein